MGDNSQFFILMPDGNLLLFSIPNCLKRKIIFTVFLHRNVLSQVILHKLSFYNNIYLSFFFADHVIELTRQSENKTQALLAALYERMSGPARPTVAILFDDLRRFLLEPEEDEFEDELDGEASKDGEGPKKSSRSEFIIPAPSPDEAVSQFFTELFPLVYRLVDENLELGDTSWATRSEVLPFGDSPRRAATSVGRALGATRVLLRSLRMGSAAVATASRRLQRSGRSSPCDAALLRMTYCARCRGIPPTLRPCAGLCLNALRGCLTPLAELELPWAAYVESAERLVAAMVGDPPTAPAQVYTSDSTSTSSRHGVARILASLDSWISEAIMYALENGPTLEKKVEFLNIVLKPLRSHATAVEKP
ncbi:hypothetical protein J437_LFUL002623 [Ladona fulva]|uniref:Uncharacterized protein n=1 Tax=Ladona fulva TaxID=123851 RepID=A0A8K0JZY3_LADFU|nr:hypothetical protein J437_LFUL002623 [Ladona fulva]